MRLWIEIEEMSASKSAGPLQLWGWYSRDAIAFQPLFHAHTL
jgi:hypothetical protein